MAKCERGYLCDVCGREVEEMTDSDLYLRYILGEVTPETLPTSPERHIRCNPILAQFISCDAFEAVEDDGPIGVRLGRGYPGERMGHREVRLQR